MESSVQKAIKISHDIHGEYAHVNVCTGTIENSAFYYRNDPDNYVVGEFHWRLSCQIGGASHYKSNETSPYAIQYAVDGLPISYRGLALKDAARAAKSAAKIQRALDRLTKTLGTPDTFTEYAVRLFLVWKPELLVTDDRGADHPFELSGWGTPIDYFRSEVNQTVNKATAAAYPHLQAA